jgi:hypothetical protein
LLKHLKQFAMRKTLVSGLLAGIAGLAASMIIGFAFHAAFPSLQAEYTSGFFRPWSDPLMNIYWAYPFLIAYALIWAWKKASILFTASNSMLLALKASLAYMLIATLPGMVISYSSYTVSVIMVLSWMTSGFFQVWATMWVIIKTKA